MATAALGRGTLEARYPLPQWVVDSKDKYGMTLAIAETIDREIADWPRFNGPTALQIYAEHVTRAVREALRPRLAWLADTITDGVSYPGDVLVSYISQLALTRPDEEPDTAYYRELLRAYARHLKHLARRFEASTPPD